MTRKDELTDRTAFYRLVLALLAAVFLSLVTWLVQLHVWEPRAGWALGALALVVGAMTAIMVRLVHAWKELRDL